MQIDAIFTQRFAVIGQINQASGKFILFGLQ